MSGLGVGNQLVSVGPAYMAIHGHGCTDGTAEQLVDRGPEQFPLDIPQCDVHRGDGAREHRASAVEIAAVHPPPVVGDGAGILADEVLRHRLHRPAYGTKVALEHRLAPSLDPCVRRDPQELPARADVERSRERIDTRSAISATAAYLRCHKGCRRHGAGGWSPDWSLDLGHLIWVT